MLPEATLEQSDARLVTASAGWFVLNARDARSARCAGRGHNLPLPGRTPEEADTLLPQLGVNLTALEPDERVAIDHRTPTRRTSSPPPAKRSSNPKKG